MRTSRGNVVYEYDDYGDEDGSSRRRRRGRSRRGRSMKTAGTNNGCGRVNINSAGDYRRSDIIINDNSPFWDEQRSRGRIGKRVDDDCQGCVNSHRIRHRSSSSNNNRRCTTTTTNINSSSNNNNISSSPHVTTNKRRAVSLGSGTGRCSSRVNRTSSGGTNQNTKKKLPSFSLHRRQQPMKQDKAAVGNKVSSHYYTTELKNRRGRSVTTHRTNSRSSSCHMNKDGAVEGHVVPAAAVGSSSSSNNKKLVDDNTFHTRWHRSRSGFSGGGWKKKQKKEEQLWSEIEYPTKGIETQFLRTWAIKNSRSGTSSRSKKKNHDDDAGTRSKEKKEEVPSTKKNLSSTSSSSSNNRRRETSLKPKHYRHFMIVEKLLKSSDMGGKKEERGDSSSRLLLQRRRNKSVPAHLGHRVTWWNHSNTNSNNNNTNGRRKEEDSSSDGSSSEDSRSNRSSQMLQKNRRRQKRGEERRSSSNNNNRRERSTSNPHVMKSPSGRHVYSPPTHNSSSVTPQRRGGRPMSRLERRAATIAGEEKEEVMHYQTQHRRFPYSSDEIISRRRSRSAVMSSTAKDEMPWLPFLNKQHKQHQGSDVECSRRSKSMPPIYTPGLRTQQRPQRQKQQQQQTTGPVIYCNSFRNSMVSSIASMDSSWVYQRTKSHRKPRRKVVNDDIIDGIDIYYPKDDMILDDTIKLVETEIEKHMLGIKTIRQSKFDLIHQEPQPLLLLLDPVITCDDIPNNPISQIASVDSSWINQREHNERRCRLLEEKRRQILKNFVLTIEEKTKKDKVRRASSSGPKLLTLRDNVASSIPLVTSGQDSIDERSMVAVIQEDLVEHNMMTNTSNKKYNSHDKSKKSKHVLDISHVLNSGQGNTMATTSTLLSNVSGSDVKTRTTTSRTGSSWDIRVPNPISSLPGSCYEEQLTRRTMTVTHPLQDMEIVSIEEGQVKTKTTMVTASGTGSSWCGGYEPKSEIILSSSGCSESLQTPCGSNALTLFGDNGTLAEHSKDGSSKDTLCSVLNLSSEDVADNATTSDSSSNVCYVQHDAEALQCNFSSKNNKETKFVVPPLHSEIRSKMPKQLSSIHCNEKKKIHMNSLNESEISGLTLPAALLRPPKPPPQNWSKFTPRYSSAHKESKDENNGSTIGSADETDASTLGSKVGRDIDINSHYTTSQLSELSLPTTLVPPMLVEALVQRYRHLSSHTKKRQSRPSIATSKATMREQISKMTMSPHSHPPRDHISSSSRAVGRDSPWKVLPPPPMPGPPFVQNRYPNNVKTNNDPSSSRDYSRSSPQDLKPLINEKNNQTRTKKLPRATRQPMESETMYQSNDNKVRKFSLQVGNADSRDGGGMTQQERIGVTSFSSWNGPTKKHAHGMIWVDPQGNAGHYSGKLENGIPHGLGVMTYSSNGLLAKGMWVHGQLANDNTFLHGNLLQSSKHLPGMVVGGPNSRSN